MVRLSDVGLVVFIVTEQLENLGQTEQIRPLLELAVEHEGEEGGDNHLGQQDGDEEDEVLVERLFQGRKLVFCYFRVERNLCLSASINTASKDLLGILENCPGQ